ncbi:MAG: hypothetical protein SFV55_15285 [Haliscomenobacter sp.]|uniref:hypothetical protein n=1 Tax=Haliscomenobacter sp. TaxID=2717303 RepID=UPI0029A56D58|nr:hypothetical protein [Haliscomenobacter sp.]MDX2069790.1 hypothetical protein [Haliscomenobacter sp.]
MFSTKTDLQVWHKIAAILKQTDQFLETKRPSANSSSEHFLKNRRQLISFLTVSRLMGDFNFSVPDLIKFNLSTITNVEFEKSWALLKNELPVQFSRSKIKGGVFLSLCKTMSKSYNMKGYERLVNTLSTPFGNSINPGRNRPQKSTEVSQEFIDQVEMLLPKQPWKPGTHKEIALKLNCSEKEIYTATNKLIEQGKKFRQKDGILFDKKGNIVGIDEDRVDSKTMKLKE